MGELIGSILGIITVGILAGAVIYVISIVEIVQLLLSCFFGYKIQKFLITITGAIIGAVIGLLSGSAVIIVLFGIAGGCFAHFFHKLGLFIHYWFYGSILFILLSIILGGGESLVFIGIVLGILNGALAVYLYKPYIIAVTAISGGICSGILMQIVFSQSSGLLIGFILAILGLIVQIQMNKERVSDNSNNT